VKDKVAREAEAERRGRDAIELSDALDSYGQASKRLGAALLQEDVVESLAR